MRNVKYKQIGVNYHAVSRSIVDRFRFNNLAIKVNRLSLFSKRQTVVIALFNRLIKVWNNCIYIKKNVKKLFILIYKDYKLNNVQWFIKKVRYRKLKCRVTHK